MSATVTFSLEHARNPIDRAELHRILDELIDAREQSDPALATAPQEISFREAKGKDAVARAIAATGSQLMLQAAGWATNHNIGRALAEKSGKAIDASSHELEIDGQHYAQQCYGEHSKEDAELGRAALQAAIDPTFYPVPVGLVWEMRDSLLALDFGETLSLFAPSRRGMHGNPFTLATLRLVVLQHVYFLIGQGVLKETALNDIAEAIGSNARRILGWETDYLPKFFSKREIQNRKKAAKDAGALAKTLIKDPSYADHTKGRTETIDGAVWGCYVLLRNPGVALASLRKQLSAAEVGSADRAG